VTGDASGDTQRRNQSLAAISDALVRLHARHYGKGPARARTFVFDHFVLCLLHDPYTTVEKTLLTTGQEDAVRANRMLFYRTLETPFRSVVEQITGRKTTAFLPQLSADPPVVSALFLLLREDS
jgi:uncharacterized protein YbcI